MLKYYVISRVGGKNIMSVDSCSHGAAYKRSICRNCLHDWRFLTPMSVYHTYTKNLSNDINAMSISVLLHCVILISPHKLSTLALSASTGFRCARIWRRPTMYIRVKAVHLCTRNHVSVSVGSALAFTHTLTCLTPPGALLNCVLPRWTPDVAVWADLTPCG